EHLGVIGLDGERVWPLLLHADAVEAVDRPHAVRAGDPAVRDAELELRGFGLLPHRVERCEQRADVDAVAHGVLDGGHEAVLSCVSWSMSKARKARPSTTTKVQSVRVHTRRR